MSLVQCICSAVQGRGSMRRRIPLWENANPRQKPEDDATPPCRLPPCRHRRRRSTRRTCDATPTTEARSSGTNGAVYHSIAYKRPSLSPRSPDRVLFSFPPFAVRSSFALIQQCSHAHVNFSCPLGHGRRTTDNAAVSNFPLREFSFS